MSQNTLCGWPLLAGALLTAASAVSRAADPRDQWTVRNPIEAGIPQNTEFHDILFAQDKFVAAAGYSASIVLGRILTSSDGTFWSETLTGVNGPLLALAYGNGKFVALGGALRGPPTTFDSSQCRVRE